mmetsp:Transcript_82975/g.268458  ORF Transcript_82975/g.268458 Transcript_82975/m.268458 type:complete len:260 (+) Transcript_82975:545-1324(+)
MGWLLPAPPALSRRSSRARRSANARPLSPLAPASWPKMKSSTGCRGSRGGRTSRTGTLHSSEGRLPYFTLYSWRPGTRRTKLPAVHAPSYLNSICSPCSYFRQVSRSRKKAKTSASASTVSMISAVMSSFSLMVMRALLMHSPTAVGSKATSCNALPCCSRAQQRHCLARNRAGSSPYTATVPAVAKASTPQRAARATRRQAAARASGVAPAVATTSVSRPGSAELRSRISAAKSAGNDPAAAARAMSRSRAQPLRQAL